MSRVMAYSGRPIPLENLLFHPSQALARQSSSPLQRGLLNLAGFGIAAWDPASRRPGDPLLYRSTTLPFFDANLRSLSEKMVIGSALAHVRGVPCGRTTSFGDQNLHPFRFPGCAWAMAHNGFLSGFEQMRRAVIGHTRPEVAMHQTGTTDSEAIYALIMSQLGDQASGDAEELVEAALKALRILRQIRRDHSLAHCSSLNLFFTNGTDLIALRFAFDYGCYPTDDRGECLVISQRDLSLWYTVGDRFEMTGGQWRMTGSPRGARSVLIASEPMTEDLSGWIEVPEYTVVIARQTASGVELRARPISV